METIPYSVKAKDITKRRVRPIPYTIIQTMKTNQVPKDMFLASQSWIKHNPEYDYEFFDDDRCIQFIKDNYNNNILTKFMVIHTGAGKADFFRWLYLYKKGGVYVDIDAVCKQSIEKVSFITKQINTTDNIFLSRHAHPIDIKKNRINHMIIISNPKVSILKLAIKKSIYNIEQLYKYKKNCLLPQILCGPEVLGEMFNILIGHKKDSYIDRKQILFNSKKDNLKIILIPKDWLYILLIPKYKNYRSNLKKLNIKHYGNSELAFNYNKCHNYLKSNNIDIKGNIATKK